MASKAALVTSVALTTAAVASAMVGGYRFPTVALAAFGFCAAFAAVLAGGGWTRRLALIVAAVAVWTTWSVAAT